MGMSKAITKSKLNLRQEKFCLEYIKDGNGSEAAIRAGYSKKTARNIAGNLLTRINIKKRIANLTQKYILKQGLVVEDVIKHMIRLTNYDISECFEEDGRLKHPKDWPEDIKHVAQGVEVVESSKGYGEDKEYYYTHKIKMPDRNKSLEMLGRYLKMFVEQVEHKGNINLTIRPASQDDGDNGKLLDE